MASTSKDTTQQLFRPPSDSEDDEPKDEGRRPPSPHKGKQRQRQDVKQDDDISGRGYSNHVRMLVDEESDSDLDDPVIKTLPVFLTPALADSLALLQYPHRPPGRHPHHPLLPPSLRPDEGTPDDRPPTERVTARYKPKVGHLEMSVPLEAEAGRQERRFNEHRAQALGRGQQESDLGELGSSKIKSTAGRGRREAQLAYEAGSDKPLRRMTLSGEPLPDQTWYACAIVKDDEVHLTPLTRTIQMRPHLKYLDRIAALDRNNARRERRALDGSDDEGQSGASSGEEDEGGTSVAQIAARDKRKAQAAAKRQANGDVKLVHATVKQEEGADGGGKQGGKGDFKTGRAAASLFGPAKAAEQELWQDLAFHDPTTEEANIVWQQLFARKTSHLSMVTKPTQYLRL